MKTQQEKGAAFRALHHGPTAFVIPNPWDVGTTMLLADAGFAALATTSAGFAFATGRPDNAVGRDPMMEHVASIAGATDLPVSGDLENGFGDDPETVAETIRLAAAHGLVGCSIEDSTTRADDPIYAFDRAVERVRAAVAAAHTIPFPFTLTARCENFLFGRDDLADTIRRLTAYRDAGADVLYAPGLKTLADVKAVVDAVERPVNVLAGNPAFTVQALSDVGVKRISLGSLLTRAAFGEVGRALDEIRTQGTFGFATRAAPFGELNGFYARAGS